MDHQISSLWTLRSMIWRISCTSSRSLSRRRGVGGEGGMMRRSGFVRSGLILFSPVLGMELRHSPRLPVPAATPVTLLALGRPCGAMASSVCSFSSSSSWHDAYREALHIWRGVCFSFLRRAARLKMERRRPCGPKWFVSGDDRVASALDYYSGQARVLFAYARDYVVISFSIRSSYESCNFTAHE